MIIIYWPITWLTNIYPDYTRKKMKSLKSISIFLCSFELSIKDEELDLHLLYWMPTIHRCPYIKQRYIAEFAKCTNRRSELAFQITLTLVTQGVVWIKYGFCDLLEYIQLGQ